MKRILLLVSMMTAFGAAHADFNVVTNANATHDPIAAATYGSRASSSGIPLGAALKEKAPKGWQGLAGKNVDTNFLVEVDTNLDWMDGLAKMAARYNLHIKVDPNVKKVYVSEGPGGMRDLDEERRRIESSVVASDQQNASRAEQEGSTDFVVRSGQKLSEALHLFLKKGDWKLEWEAGSDFTVKQGYAVTGKSLRDVLDAALTPFGVHAVLYTVNRVVVVRSNAVLTSPNANQ